MVNLNQYVWTSNGQVFNGNRANIEAYLSEGIIRLGSANTNNTLAYRICELASNAKPNAFISKGEILQAQREVAKLFPADYMLVRIDKLVRKHSCFNSMADLCAAFEHGYRPTLYIGKCAERRLIADYYDACMGQVGNPARVYRVNA